MKMRGTFKCDMCGEEFERVPAEDWSEKDVDAELTKNFGYESRREVPGGYAVVCTRCYVRVLSGE